MASSGAKRADEAEQATDERLVQGWQQWCLDDPDLSFHEEGVSRYAVGTLLRARLRS